MAIKVGVLGGGQLGRMLLSPAMNFGLDISILDPDPNAPCKDFCNQFFVGDLNSFEDVFSFGKNLDIITIEIENVNTKALIELKKNGKKIIPNPEHLKLIKDKGLQKQFYLTHKIPTAKFSYFENSEELKKANHNFPFIQKLCTGGYDGRGVLKIKSEIDYQYLFNDPSIVEEIIDFSMEISVIIARKENGEIKVYDPIEMEFNPIKNIVEYLIIPARVSKKILQDAENLAIEIVQKMDFVGLLAVEMFIDKSGNVLVNEIAPRPHNSGHHTIEACITSQYEQLLRIILDYPLGSTHLNSPAVTINILGTENHEGEVKYEGLNDVLFIPNTHVHLYGKKITKPFRKMGHVTIINQKIELALEEAKRIINTLKAIA